MRLGVSLATNEDKNMPMIIEHLNNDDDYRRSFEYVSSIRF